ncbi:hypothetical protein QYE76_054199 [Lolium multiflorum]|uniref:Uncharacterized protein n=1 Tax=Lolium multiflorum TaxID=4521 RepID=A0AAD8WN99_LOLMU|nr:hypothetical protein QYE76_054199 [Lolium multiflorum]
MTMAWALTELLRQPDAAAATTEKLDRIVGSTDGGEAGDAGRDSQQRPAPTLVAHAAATPWLKVHGAPMCGFGCNKKKLKMKMK